MSMSVADRGKAYYPTDRLKAGTEVQVFRRERGGWCAIRPPVGSFSWVAGHALELQKDNLAKVVEDHPAARVGSRFSEIRDVVQVHLKRGEIVEVLESKRSLLADGAGGGMWYKIAPPAGEFRWVAAKHVQPDELANRSRGAKADGGLGRAHAEPRRDRPPEISAEQFQKAMNDLDVELSTMVVEEPTVWDFAELRVRAETLVEQAGTAAARGQAGLALGKIARFEEILQRYKKLSRQDVDSARLDRQLSRLGPGALAHDPDGRFDAVGRLVRVAAPSPGGPQYAIVDTGGAIRCYVSPAPGVNLASYLGRDIGVNGTRGLLLAENAAHVMARHVTLVDAAMLR